MISFLPVFLSTISLIDDPVLQWKSIENLKKCLIWRNSAVLCKFQKHLKTFPNFSRCFRYVANAEESKLVLESRLMWHLLVIYMLHAITKMPFLSFQLFWTAAHTPWPIELNFVIKNIIENVSPPVFIIIIPVDTVKICCCCNCPDLLHSKRNRYNITVSSYWTKTQTKNGAW